MTDDRTERLLISLQEYEVAALEGWLSACKGMQDALDALRKPIIQKQVEASGDLFAFCSPGTVWVHKKTGNLYMLVGWGQLEATHEPLIHYVSLSDKGRWMRPLAEWKEKFELSESPEEEQA